MRANNTRLAIIILVEPLLLLPLSLSHHPTRSPPLTLPVKAMGERVGGEQGLSPQLGPRGGSLDSQISIAEYLMRPAGLFGWPVDFYSSVNSPSYVGLW